MDPAALVLSWYLRAAALGAARLATEELRAAIREHRRLDSRAEWLAVKLQFAAEDLDPGNLFGCLLYEEGALDIHCVGAACDQQL